MGDVLLLTALCKHNHNCMIYLNSKAKKFSRFFRNICEDIVIADNMRDTLEEGQGSIIERKLRFIGMEGANCLPYVDVTEEEKLMGKQKISQYKNPIVFVPNCSINWKKKREAPPHIWQDIINSLSNKYTFLQFGISSNLTRFKNTELILDLDMDELICYYAAIGKYIGVDTGDMHLMLAVGGQCRVLVPPTSPEYSHSDWHYKSPKIRYVEFKEYKSLKEC